MIDLWRRHVAWRLMSEASAPRHLDKIAAARARRQAKAEGVCTRCHGPRDDPRYQRCKTCRGDTSKLQRRRLARKRAQANGTACSKCGNENPDAGKFKLCPLCRERARDVAARQRMKHATQRKG